MAKTTFRIGGVHPDDAKVSRGCAIEVLPLPQTVYISMAQHLGAPAKPVVAVGDSVKAGQLIAEAGGFISANVHSSVSGTVKSIAPRKDIAGNNVLHVEIAVEGDEWAEGIDLSDTLVTDIPEDRAAIQADLESMPEVASVEYVDQAQAWEDFQNRFANQQALVEATQEGDIPDNFRVQLVDPSQYEKVQESFRNRAGVDMVSNDKDVLDRFFELFDVLKWAALTFAIVQLAAAALLIGNTIRLSAYSRRRETGIMRLVGASNFYIQLPFLLEGAICGLIGGIIASGFIVAARYVLLDKIQDWFYSGVRLSTGALLSVIGMSIILGVLLCAIASFLTLRRYLRV